MDEPYTLATPDATAVEKPIKPDLSNLVTEDDEPVDNFAAAKQQRFLVEPLYSSAKLQRPFLADSNVAIYSTPGAAPIVPDMFLSQGVQVADDWWEKENRSYLLWEFGKSPEVVIEIVSNQKGNEDGDKLHAYAALDVLYYVIYDPQQLLSSNPLRVYQLVVDEYLLRPDARLAEIGLALRLWYGSFEDKTALWLRWCDLTDRLILTGAERAIQADARAEQERIRAEQERAHAEQERVRAEQERERAEQEHIRAEQERERAEQAQIQANQADAVAKKLAAQLRALGIEPEME